MNILTVNKVELLNQIMEGDGIDDFNAPLFNVQEIRHWMNMKTLKEGKVDCPACKSHIQSYKRTISSSQIYWMCLLDKYSRHGQRWVDHKKVSNSLYEKTQRNASDAPLLVHWGLIEVNPERSGEYRITGKGVDFINGRIQVEKYLTFTNNKVWKRSPELIRMFDTKKFDLNDITNLNL